MSVSPPSDIVLDVIRAAEPSGPAPIVAAGTAVKSAAKGAVRDAAAGLWAESMKAAGKIPAEAASMSSASRTGGCNPPADAPRAQQARNARLRGSFQKLESVFLQNVLGGVLSASAGGLYGKGLAGQYWQSLMSRAIAEKIAASGGTGVAASLMRTARRAPLGGAAAASALGVRQRFEARFLARLDADAVSAPAGKERS